MAGLARLGRGFDDSETRVVTHLRIVHLSDIHVWRFSWNPLKLASKRALGMASLAISRARRFRLERLPAVVERVMSLAPDHVLITGDLTTTALPAEFQAAVAGLAPILEKSWNVTMVPGNHDRYTGTAARGLAFERAFRDCTPSSGYPWLRKLDDRTAILALDPTQAHYSARGRLPAAQFARARELLAVAPAPGPSRLILACHYPLFAPPGFRFELAMKRLENAGEIADWLSTVGPHIYCCGHVHAPWAYRPDELRNQLCLNPGAPLIRDHTGIRTPGFFEIHLEGEAVIVHHHGWIGQGWRVETIYAEDRFFPSSADEARDAGLSSGRH